MAEPLRRTDWRRLAGLAMTRLGWPPNVFWAATPADLLCALDALRPDPGARPPMARDELGEMLARFPDGDCNERIKR